ncbi:MAG: TRAP transporter TatT component family protein [Myxococcota bacterium]
MALGGSLATSGCNLNRITANSTSGMLAYGSIAMDREADVEFARYAFPASLKTLETFLVNSPENENLLLLLARGYSSYAFAILEHDLDVAHHTGPDELVDSLERRAKIHYLRGREYGFRLLNRPALEEAARNDDYETLDKELAALSEKDAPGLFWAAYGWSSAINLAKDDASMLTALGTIERLMARMVELDEDYNGGAPLLFHGVYHSAKPAMFGGKPELSKEFFDRAMASHGDSNLLVPFLYARFYCPQVQDRALFDELMGKISAADLTAHPNMRLNNEVARQRAMYWTKHVDEIILEEG